VTAGSIQRDAMITSVLFAGAIGIAANLAGQMSVGVGLGVGLVVGSFNGFLVKLLLDRGAPILATAFLRLAFFSILALGLARLMGGSVWPVVTGIATAQLVMMGISARRGWRT
jgi:hypothetical protein